MYCWVVPQTKPKYVIISASRNRGDIFWQRNLEIPLVSQWINADLEARRGSIIIHLFLTFSCGLLHVNMSVYSVKQHSSRVRFICNELLDSVRIFKSRRQNWFSLGRWTICIKLKWIINKMRLKTIVRYFPPKVNVFF